MSLAHIAPQIFTGERWVEGVAVICNNNRIIDLVKVDDIPADIDRHVYHEGFIAPAFIDLQIYGAYDRLLSVYPEEKSLSLLSQYCEKGGAAFCLPTVATNTLEVFYKSIDAIRSYWANGGEGILGIHLEGPWINPVKKGAHIESLIHSPTVEEVMQLLSYGEQVIRMITLAPEVCSEEVVQLILQQGIIVSAGHSNATYDQAIHGFSNGIKAVTHLFNAMSPLQHRAPGLAGAAMDTEQVMASIIPDGHHVDFPAIRIAKKAMGERLFVITDAVTQTDRGDYQHYAAGDKYEAAGILSGSALNMSMAVKNLVQKAGIETGEALRMCSLYPARVISRKHELGMIQPGYLSSMVLMNEQLEAIQLIK